MEELDKATQAYEKSKTELNIAVGKVIRERLEGFFKKHEKVESFKIEYVHRYNDELPEIAMIAYGGWFEYQNEDLTEKQCVDAAGILTGILTEALEIYFNTEETSEATFYRDGTIEIA